MGDSGILWNGRMHAAVDLAGRIHARQSRKGTAIPYMAHLFDVASIVMKRGGNETEIAAALLHDAIEDGPADAAEQVRAACGEAVLELVRWCTDATTKPKPPWRPRKEAFVARIAGAPAAAKLVCAADKLANVSDMLRDARDVGPSTWGRFNAAPEAIVWYHRAVEEAMAKDLDDPRVLGLLKALAARTDELARLVAAPANA